MGRQPQDAASNTLAGEHSEPVLRRTGVVGESGRPAGADLSPLPAP
jgi:hypothetical protein